MPRVDATIVAHDVARDARRRGIWTLKGARVSLDGDDGCVRERARERERARRGRVWARAPCEDPCRGDRRRRSP